MKKCRATRARMYIFKNPPVTIPLSNVKMGPRITPINYAYLAVWERKYSHSPKTWECVTKTKQPNKLGPAHSSRGLKHWVPAEGQSALIVTQAVQHGNLSSGTHPGRNVPDDGFFFHVSAGGHVSLPLLLKRTGTLQNPSSHGGGVHINIFEIAFQCAL